MTQDLSQIAWPVFTEYKSKAVLFGLPLVHIIRVGKGGEGGQTAAAGKFPTARGIFALGIKAKGVVAVGNLAAGIISFGNVSAGVISFGNISAGIISFGNLSLALLFALANLAAAPFAIGNLAAGCAAVGNIAAGVYSSGGNARSDMPDLVAYFFKSVSDFAANRTESEMRVLFFGLILVAVAFTFSSVFMPRLLMGRKKR